MKMGAHSHHSLVGAGEQTLGEARNLDIRILPIHVPENSGYLTKGGRNTNSQGAWLRHATYMSHPLASHEELQSPEKTAKEKGNHENRFASK